jgi:shikimate dehydrogenase
MKVFCILGDERALRTKSPAMFTEIFKRVGIKGIYVPFRVDPGKVGQAVQSLRILNIAGANVTVPYKEAILPHLDELSEGATIIGAVNTIICTGDFLKGYNTNAIGFMDTLDEIGFDATGKSALVFGTGGAAKAAVFILNWLRADSILVAGRNQEKAGQIVSRIGGEIQPWESLLDRPIPVDIVVNATSVSSPDDAPELAALTSRLEIPGCKFVLDINYGYRKNIWQELARAKGARFSDGLSILAYQAKRTFALWTRIQVEPDEFLKVLKEVPGA